MKKRKGGRYAIAAVLVLLIVGGVIAGRMYNRQTMDQTTRYWFDKMAKEGTLSDKPEQELQGMLNGIVAEGMYNVSINAVATFENGKSKGAIGIENIPQNRYYSQVTLIREDDGSVIYESKGIKPGEYIDEIKLSKNLSAGTYPCTARFVATDPETLAEVGQVDIQVQVVVLN